MKLKKTYNCCPGVGCHAGCIHTMQTRDGKLIKAEATTYPDGDKGAICIKGSASVRLPYLPNRLKHPLKRVGERGEGKWERITWEQALDEIADKLKKIIREYNPQAIAANHFMNSQSPSDSTHYLPCARLLNLLQVTLFQQGTGVDSNGCFSAYFSVGSCFGNIADPRTLVEGKTKYMINWGQNPVETGNRFWQSIRKAKQAGAKLVTIGLMEDPTAKASDWFIQVKAGSDGALGLAMINEIIEEGLYDRDYVCRHTNGPFLVRSDNGQLLRESDLSPDGSSDNYVLWDKETNGPLSVVPKSQAVPGARPALTGTFELAGVACKPAFQLLAEEAGRIAMDDVEKISGVSPSVIEKLAREYASAKPAAILVGCGLRYKNSGNTYRTMDVLGALTGNIGVLGGGTIWGQQTTGPYNAPMVDLNTGPIVCPTGTVANVVPAAQIFQSISEGVPYPIKALLFTGINPVHTHPDRQRWINDIFPKLDLFVVYDIFMTGTAEHADYVLPDCSVFEREDMTIGHGGYIVYNEKNIEPVGESRPGVFYWSELGKRLGFGEHFDKNIDQWQEMRLQSKDSSIAGIDPPLTLARLKKEKMVRANIPKEIYHPFQDKKFLTPSGRVEFYHEALVPSGDALPVYREQKESPRSSLAEKYPLVFNTCNEKYFMHTMFSNDPVILEKYTQEPRLRINRVDAGKRNISDGDVLKVYNDRGSFKIKALISEGVPAGVVHVAHGWAPGQFIEGHLQNLTLPQASLDFRDETREIMSRLAKDQYSPFGYPEASFSYCPDTLFDCLCEVKKSD